KRFPPPYWTDLQPTGQHVWTDRGPNSTKHLWYQHGPSWAALVAEVANEATEELNLALVRLFEGESGVYNRRTTIFRAGSVLVRKEYVVAQDDQGFLSPQGDHHLLMRGGVNRGTNYLKPDNPTARGNPAKDFSRLATTYNHRLGPAGIVLERFNWFPGPANTYWADARLPASLVGLGIAPLGTSNLPLGQLVGAWSEPPVAVVGLYAGTFASYARPFQHVHFYERDGRIRDLSVPPAGRTAYFHYVGDALRRGAEVRVVGGAEREALRQGPRRFYRVLLVETTTQDRLVDVPKELPTREALALYFELLAPGGLVCFHVSNRDLDLVPLVADVSGSLGFVALRGWDQAPDNDFKSLRGSLDTRGHFR